MVCKSCGEKYSKIEANFDVDSEEMMTEILDECDKGERCPDCIFETAFINETERQWASEAKLK